MSKITCINRNILIWAREIRKIPHEQIVWTMGNDNYSKWEIGEDNPTFAQLEKLMGLYRFPVAVAFFPEPPESPELKLSLRTLPHEVIETLDYKFIRLTNKAKTLQLSLEELGASNGIHQSNKEIKSMILNGTFNSSIDMLEELFSANGGRNLKLNTPKKLFDFWRDLLFDYGIYVFKDSFRNDEVSGFSIYSENYPLIYINNSHAHTRQLFTLFHEIYHIILKTDGVDFTRQDALQGISYDLEAEYKCNEFSGKFLVPENTLRIYFNNTDITTKSIADFANARNVSREVIARRLFDCNLISFENYVIYSESFKDDFKRISPISLSEVRGNYYNNIMSYLGSKYLELSFGAYYSGEINLLTLSRVTNMKHNTLKEIATRKHWGNV